MAFEMWFQLVPFFLLLISLEISSGSELCATLSGREKNEVGRICLPRDSLGKVGVKPGGKCKEITVSQVKQIYQNTDFMEFEKLGDEERKQFFLRIMPLAEWMTITEQLEKGEITEQMFKRILMDKMKEVNDKYEQSLQAGRAGADPNEKVKICGCDKTDCNSKDKDSTRPDMTLNGSGPGAAKFVFGNAICALVGFGSILLRLGQI